MDSTQEGGYPGAIPYPVVCTRFRSNPASAMTFLAARCGTTAGVPGRISVNGKRKLGFVVYQITDNGRGIDPRDHQRVFDLFRRAGVQDRPGQGIGLAHVGELVRRMGGNLSLSSQLGEGSTFTITLPAEWAIKDAG